MASGSRGADLASVSASRWARSNSATRSADCTRPERPTRDEGARAHYRAAIYTKDATYEGTATLDDDGSASIDVADAPAALTTLCWACVTLGYFAVRPRNLERFGYRVFIGRSVRNGRLLAVLVVGWLARLELVCATHRGKSGRRRFRAHR